MLLFKHAENSGIHPKISKWKARGALLMDLFGDFLKNRLALIGIVVVASVLVIALLAPVIQIYDPLEQNISERLQTPSAQHILGTDHFGRDVWSRIVHGARIALMVGIFSVSLGILFGLPIGAIAGYYRGWLDEVMMRSMDALLAIPPILIALLMVSVLGGGLLNMMIAIGVVYIPRFARVVRGAVLSEREKEYVEAAKMVGEHNLSILFCQILPNCLSPLIVQATIFIGYAILTEAALGFLGLGLAPPNPSWGSMLNEARLYITVAPFLAFIPGMAISITVLGFNLFGDGLRDILDPRLRVD